MPDPNATPAEPVTTPATTVPATSTTVAPEPVKPAVEPAKTEVPETPIDPQTRFEIPKKDGTVTEASLQDMADAYMGTLDPGDPEATKRFDAFEKAVKTNDRQAMHDLLDLYVPAAGAAKPASSVEDRLAALEQENKALKTALGTQQPIVEQIEDARIHGGVKKLIEQQAEHLPYLAHAVADGARMVTARIAEYREAAKVQMGLSDQQFNDHPRRQQILAAAMLDCERQVKAQVERYQNFKLQEVKPDGKKPEGTVTVDDQRSGPSATPDHVPARYQVINGQLVDRTGHPTTQMRHGEIVTVPTEPLVGEPAGNAVGPVPVEQGGQPFTMDQLRARMRRQSQETVTE